MSKNPGKPNPFFFNELGQIQWAWRLLAFFVVFIVVSQMVNVWFQIYDPRSEDPIIETLWLILRFATLSSVTIALTWLTLRAFDRRNFASFGLMFHKRWTAELVLGLVAGSGLVLAAVGIISAFGFTTFRVSDYAWADVGALIVLNLVLSLFSAVSIETFFRGYVLQVISEGQGKIFASLFMSFVTALLQTQFRSELWLHGVNLAVWNLIACVCYFRTRTLWTSIGLQMSAAFMQTAVFGNPSLVYHPTFSFFQVELTSRNMLSGDYVSLLQGLLPGSILVVALYYLIHSRQLEISDAVRKVKYDALSKSFLKGSNG